jgi:hypothetical protein
LALIGILIWIYAIEEQIEAIIGICLNTLFVSLLALHSFLMISDPIGDDESVHEDDGFYHDEDNRTIANLSKRANINKNNESSQPISDPR